MGYSYDKNGNRQTETRNASVLTYVYAPAGSNWLYQRGSDTRSKQANGNTTFGSTFGTLAYDGYNRIAQLPMENMFYSYNAVGERIKKVNPNGLGAYFHYNPNGELLYERDQAGNTKAYVWLDGRPLARIDNDASIYYYHVDHLGTPQAMTNAAGAIVWKADYDPFGKASVRVSTIENNLRLPGQYYDRETGLHYNYFRDYDSSTGRYVESDPIGLDGGINLYEYAKSAPTMYTDPKGENVATPVIIGLIVYGGYELYSSYRELVQCKQACKTATKKQCDAGDTRGYHQCESQCLLKSFGGLGSKGPKGPTPDSPYP